ncbi:MAG: orotate phosphoribosyltransferase [Candidatus Omnitrophota bacterium]
MKKKLLKIIKKDAFFKKKIKLSSGKTSNYYIDIRRVSLDSQGLYLTSKIIWEMIKKDKPTAIGGPTLGADAIIGGVCVLAHKEGKKLKVFIVRKTPKKHGRQNLIEGKELTPKDRVVLIDDVATTGASLVKSFEILKEAKVKVIKVIVVVDREEGAKEAFSNLNYLFQPIFTKSDLL